jgi:hypothetical protein
LFLNAVCGGGSGSNFESKIDFQLATWQPTGNRKLFFFNFTAFG